jgi:hypothetical protein
MDDRQRTRTAPGPCEFQELPRPIGPAGVPLAKRSGLLLTALLLAHATVSRADQAMTRQEQAVINFGFATQLGSGIYTLSGRTLQVYKLPFSWTLPAEDEARVRTRLTLPVTIGLADFKPTDVIESGLPRNLDTLSFVPGVEVRVSVADNWRLEPFVEAGIARDKTNDLDERVYSGGLRSRYEYLDGTTHWEFYEELLYVLVEQRSNDTTDDCTRFRLGATARRAFGGMAMNRHPDYLVYGMADVYTDTPNGPADGEVSNGGGAQFEFGVTFGTVESISIWHVPLPRLGLGYRFGEGLSVFRVVFGTPF